MTVRKLLLAGLAAGAFLPLAPAWAQTPPPPPPLTYGAPIPGLCTFSLNQILATSKVGQSVEARLKVLDSQWRAELQPQAEAINTDKTALDAQASTLDRATLEAKSANLQLRYTNFQKLVQQRAQEMQATQQKQVAVVQRQLDPILRELFQGHTCSILFERDSGGVAVVNPAMDLSAAAVSSLDARIQTLTFDREHIEPGAQPPAGQ
jgi:Skp family chaperone for outer membrane proteins